jgi:hypothetical protein
VNADLIAKIQKLRALAQSTNVNEAANAAAAAEKLIAEHQLTEAELESSSNPPANEPTEEDADPIYFEAGDRRASWRWWLAGGLARLYGVALVGAHMRQPTGEKSAYFPYDPVVAWGSGVRAIGRKSDVEIMRYQYAYLSVEIERLTQKFLS